MWYVCRVVLWVSATGFILNLVGVIASQLWPSIPSVAVSPIITLPIITFVVCYFIKWAIERALHYQREREILFILETAHWLRITERAPNIFDGICGCDWAQAKNTNAANAPKKSRTGRSVTSPTIINRSIWWGSFCSTHPTS